MPSLAALGEAAVLKKLAQALNRPSQGLIEGIGDDAALLRALGPAAVLTCDVLVEDIDFRRRWASMADIGHKAAAANLSDLAAMGAQPRGLLASVALPATTPLAELLMLLKSLNRLGRRYGAPLVGGDLSATHQQAGLFVAVTAVGQVDAKRALRRHRGQPGDVVMVTGPLGGAAAGLALLEQGSAKWPALRRRQLRPLPQIAVARELAANGWVRAAADISDGLAKDVLHLPQAGCGITLATEHIPLAPGLKAAAAFCRHDPLAWALYGGEDFELVLAVPAKAVARALLWAQRQQLNLQVIGVVNQTPGLHFSRGFAPGGRAFEHFLAG